MRVVPLENEAINECWLSDKDRFSYEGLNSEERLLAADDQARRRAGVETDWQTALEHVVRRTRAACATSTAARQSARSRRRTRRSKSCISRRSSCAASAATTSISACARSDFSADARRATAAVPWLGMTDRRVRGARSRAGHRQLPAQGPSAARAAPAAVDQEGRAGLDSAFRRRRAADDACAQVDRRAVGACRGAGGDRRGRRARPPAAALRPTALAGRSSRRDDRARRSPRASRSGERKGIFLGNFAQQHPQAAQLHALAQSLAELTGAKLGFLTEAANSRRRLSRRRASRSDGGLNAQAMLGTPSRVVQGVPAAARRARARHRRIPPRRARRSAARNSSSRSRRSQHGARTTSMWCCRSAPFTETAGTFVNCEGRAQSVHRRGAAAGRDASGVEGAARARIDARACRASATTASKRCAASCRAGGHALARLSNATARRRSRGARRSRRRCASSASPTCRSTSPIRWCVALRRCRRRRDARAPRARVNASTLAALGLADGGAARVRQAGRRSDAEGRSSTTACPTAACASPPRTRSTSTLGPMFGADRRWRPC